MLISTWRNPLVSMVYNQIFQRCNASTLQQTPRQINAYFQQISQVRVLRGGPHVWLPYWDKSRRIRSAIYEHNTLPAISSADCLMIYKPFVSSIAGILIWQVDGPRSIPDMISSECSATCEVGPLHSRLVKSMHMKLAPLAQFPASQGEKYFYFVKNRILPI